MDDLKHPQQPPIVLHVRGEGSFRTVVDGVVPQPPEDCETQQVMDWAACLGLFTNPQVGQPLKLRAVEAYAMRWSIPTEEKPWTGR